MLVRSKSCTTVNCVCGFDKSYLAAAVTMLFIGSSVFTGSIIFVNAYAQSPLPLLPPPSPTTSNDVNHNLHISSNDHTPPEINIVNAELKQGKNLLVVKITDLSDLKSQDVKYVDKGEIIVTDLVNDNNNQYEALVNVQPPTCIIVIDATDAANNTASIAKEFKVTQESETIVDQFISWLKGVFSNF